MARLLSIRDAASLLDVHQNTLRAWADRGLVPHTKLPGGHRRFAREDIERFARELRRGQRPVGDGPPDAEPPAGREQGGAA